MRNKYDENAIDLALMTGLLSPAAGGLFAAVPDLVKTLSGVDNSRVRVIGIQDSDMPGAAKDWGGDVYAHSYVGPRSFGYSPNMGKTLRNLSPKIIDVQGIWTYSSLVNLRHHQAYGTPYLITPHGMLDRWARRHSYWKKRGVGIWFEDEHLAGAKCLRATAEMEAEHFRSYGLTNPIAIVPNGIDVGIRLTPRPCHSPRRLLFLSRIHPKKGINYLLRAWKAVQSRYPDWELAIVGPDEVGHTLEMQRLSNRLGLERVVWEGEVRGSAKSILYRSADVLVLPTHAENFGLVVAEALAHEVPVITTKNAPWAGLSDHHCGWWIDLDDESLQNALSIAMSKPRAALWEMGERGRVWMERDFGWDRVTDQMLEVYGWISGRRLKPDYVYD